DSLGTSQVVSEGGTQWMNAGAGIVHSERPAKELAEEGGEFEIIQFWINTPANEKMEEASYQPISKEETPLVNSPDNLVEIAVVAGQFDSKNGPVKASSEVLILRLTMTENGEIEVPVPENYNALIYQL